jgi:hypothetical protein
VVHVGRQLPVTVSLAGILERSFPEEYEARRAETRSAAASATDAATTAEEAPLPLFVMSVMMPGACACMRCLSIPATLCVHLLFARSAM